jgi:pyruvate formate lyase activating enzyme
MDDLCSEVLKDSAYLLNSVDGGITASGGEAAFQSEYVSGLFERMRKAGLSTALDTSGFCPTHRLKEAARHAELILYDLKLADAKKHKQMVGGDLSVVLENLASIIGMEKRIWIRTPIIPGFTDGVENVEGIARIILEFCMSYGQNWFERWELCAFNNLCSDKYSRLGKPWPLAGVPLMDENSLNRLVEAVVSLGLPLEKISWTGMTATEGQQT